jgi:hypothetical protein
VKEVYAKTPVWPYVKNLTKRSAEALVAAREVDGPSVLLKILHNAFRLSLDRNFTLM